MLKHKQVWQKVNVPVDEGVRNLIDSLSLFSQLQTIECCQGNYREFSFVSFLYGRYWEHPWKDLANFVLGYLGPGITQSVGDTANISIRVSGVGQIYGELTVKQEAIPAVTDTIISLYREKE